jgi:hypothetical protein
MNGIQLAMGNLQLAMGNKQLARAPELRGTRLLTCQCRFGNNLSIVYCS